MPKSTTEKPQKMLSKELKISYIGIRFYDNDFTYTFCGMLEHIGVMMRYGLLSFDGKQAIVDYMNSISFDCYCIYQSGSDEPNDHIRNYLFLDESHIFLDSEVDALLESDYFRNREFHVLDVSNGIVDSF